MVNLFNLFWHMVLRVNVYHFKLGKETLSDRCFKSSNPDLDHTSSPPNSWQGKQNSDCFATLAVSL
jgi:hypothetical protein